MRSIRYEKTDAFTSGGEGGNPAACLYLSEGELNASEMQHIAAQHRGFVSEVVFCEEAGGGVRCLSYYSSECEVSFCGHGTIACMYSIMRNDPFLSGKDAVCVATSAKGMIKVYNELARLDAVFIAAPPPVFIGAGLGRETAAGALRLAPASIDRSAPLDVVDAGLRTLIVPIAGLEALVTLAPDEAELKTFCMDNDIDIVICFCRETAEPGFRAHTRVFAPRFGYLEDPATGSGSAALGNYLLRNGLWDGGDIALEQGGAVFSLVRLGVREGRVVFGGGATPRIRGEYFI